MTTRHPLTEQVAALRRQSLYRHALLWFVVTLAAIAEATLLAPSM